MLRPEEIDRIKYELGVNLERIGAEPYLTYLAIFDRVIAPYLFDNSTTSLTPVTAGAGPVAITLAANPAPPNNTGLTFNVGTNVLVDVGPSQEVAVITFISGLIAQMSLVNAHTGGSFPYPIAPVGTEYIVRKILARIDAIQLQMDTIAPQTAGIENVDGPNGVTFVTAGSGRRTTQDMFQSLTDQRERARDDLGEAVGFANLRRVARGGMHRIELY